VQGLDRRSAGQDACGTGMRKCLTDDCWTGRVPDWISNGKRDVGDRMGDRMGDRIPVTGCGM